MRDTRASPARRGETRPAGAGACRPVNAGRQKGDTHVRTRTVVLAFAALLAIATASQSQTPSPGERETLRRLPGLQVVIGGITPEAEQDGLHKDAIQADVERQLRLAGIKVLSKSAAAATSMAPYVYVSVGLLKSTDLDVYGWSLQVTVKQVVTLASEKRAVATTWSIGLVGVSSSQLLSQLRSDIKDLVDTLISDWIVANAKR